MPGPVACDHRPGDVTSANPEALSRTQKRVARLAKTTGAKLPTDGFMETDGSFADIKMLAQLAARLAGRDPDEHVTVKIADVVAFEGEVWRYPDFINRAEAAYKLLNGGTPS